jgi:hypothetical protein
MLPQGGHFVAGTGSIGTQGITETITQTSQRGIIDFNSFSIGKSGTVKINNGTRSAGSSGSIRPSSRPAGRAPAFADKKIECCPLEAPVQESELMASSRTNECSQGPNRKCYLAKAVSA